MTKKENLAIEAKHLCRAQHSGVLSTISSAIEGYPFGSVTPFMLTEEGDPIIYISDLAQHTRNLKQNNKVSLIVYDATQDDSQANARVTILGDAELIAAESDEEAQIKSRYFTLFPQAQKYQQTHDFNFYRIRTHRVRYIGGFGKIHWIQKEFWMTPQQDWQTDTSGMCEHMNIDHLDAMQLMVKHHYKADVQQLKMVGAYQEGCHLQDANNNLYFIPFQDQCLTAMDVRKELVRLTQLARQQLAA